MIEIISYGKLAGGQEVHAFVLTNSSGASVTVMEYGATVSTLMVPDRTGHYADVVLGHKEAAEYEQSRNYFGAIVGRYGNRINKGKLTIAGKAYGLTCNNGEHHLHGGERGFDRVLWFGKPAESGSGPAVVMRYVSPDGDEGYPGTVDLSVTYTLTENNELRIQDVGTTDKTTVLNPTHHSYFNLTGDVSKNILGHQLLINADAITPVDEGLIPTGVLTDVTNTPFDFRSARTIGERINSGHHQLHNGKGYDHNWVIKKETEGIVFAASVFEPKSGRSMEVFTDQPGIQFYSGNYLDGSTHGKNGSVQGYRSGFCLEAQCFPDSPNKPQWKSPVLNPGETYRQTTIYKFSSR